MNKEVSDFQAYNSICEAVGCSAIATNKITVKVGNLGSIPLSLCSDCLSEFQKNEVRRDQNQEDPVQNRIESKQSRIREENRSCGNHYEYKYNFI